MSKLSRSVNKNRILDNKKKLEASRARVIKGVEASQHHKAHLYCTQLSIFATDSAPIEIKHFSNEI